MNSCFAQAVSVQMRDAAQTFATQIEEGEFEALTVGQRCELRMLPMALHSWADRVETLEQERWAEAMKRHLRARRWKPLLTMFAGLAVAAISIGLMLVIFWLVSHL